MNDIKELLNLKADDIVVYEVIANDEEMTKYVIVHKIAMPMYCPICGSRIHSRGTYPRTINHAVLQDGYKVKIILKQRRYKCTDRDCRYE